MYTQSTAEKTCNGRNHPKQSIKDILPSACSAVTDDDEFAVYEDLPVDKHFMYRAISTNNLILGSVGQKARQ